MVRKTTKWLKTNDIVHPFLQEFNHLISKNYQKFSKAVCSVDETSNFAYRFSSKFKESKNLETQFDLIKKTSKIRNKDSLEDNILV